MEITKCMGCMEEFQGYPCPKCGYDPKEDQKVGFSLPLETIVGGKYLVGKVLGQGGFGITYIGWDIALERKVAIKEYYPSGQVSRMPGTRSLVWSESQQGDFARQDGMQVFLREARKMAKLEDIPGVVKVRDLFQENDSAYIVMDFVEGKTLKAILKEKGPMTWDQAKPIFRAAIQAMDRVHKAGLVHRDLSPDNLMIGSDGSVKILDLGAAKDLNISSGASSMQVAKGGFSPYEQYTQRGGSGAWTDVYAMAATIYFTLTGKLPPVSVDRVTEDLIKWDLPGLQTLPGPALHALKRAMAVLPNKRTQSMAELEQGLFPPEIPGPKPIPKSLPKWLIPAVAAAAAVVVIAGGIGVWAKVIKPANDYKSAMALLESEEYGEAAEAFKALGDYKDSMDRVAESRQKERLQRSYQNAQTMMDNGQYFQAMQAFSDLDFKDSADKAQEAKEAYWISQRLMLTARHYHSAGLRKNGTAVASGYNSDGRCNVSSWSDIVSLSAGDLFTAGLRENGTVVAVGNNEDGQLNVTGWTDIVMVRTGGPHTVGLRSDGTVVATGNNEKGQCDVGGWSDMVAVAAGGWHSVGLRSDGTVVAIGHNDDGRCDVSGWTDVVALAAGTWHTIGLRKDGTVVATGSNASGQCNVSGWTDIVAVAGGTYVTLGVRSDGTVVATGNNENGQCNVSDWTDIVAVAAGKYHSLGLRSDGTVVATGYNDDGECDARNWTDIRTPG